MEEIQNENSSIFSYEGFIGRRNYIINSLIVGILVSIFLLPIYTKLDPFDTYNSIQKAGIPYFILLVLIMLLFSVPTAFNVKKRLSDILGKNLENSVTCFLVLILMMTQVASFLNVKSSLLVSCCLIIFQFVMYIKKGKISNSLPKSEIIKFNWGAFFGTWIWGLVNRSYISLLMIPLFFTPANFLFMLLLGLKGNEWAYKNRQYSSVEEMHKSQKNQATFWSIFAPFMGVISFICVFIAIVFAVVASEVEAQKNPNSGPTFAEAFYEVMLGDIFDSYQYENHEYRFYVNPKKWVKLPYNSKMEAFNNAYKYAKYRNYKSKNKYPNYKIIHLTKIYSSYNKELLMEYRLDNISKDDKGLDAIKKVIRGYKINQTPTIP